MSIVRNLQKASTAAADTGAFSEDFESGLGNYTPSGTTNIFIVTDLNGNALTGDNAIGSFEIIERDFGSATGVTTVEFDAKVAARAADDVGGIGIRDNTNTRIVNIGLARSSISDSLRRSHAFTDSTSGPIGPVLVIGTTYHYIIVMDFTGNTVTVTIKDGETTHAGPTVFAIPAGLTTPRFLQFFQGGNDDAVGVGRFDDIISS